MKITFFLLFAAMIQVSAAGFAQKVTFTKEDATLEQVFNQINKQTGYNVFWSPKLIKNSQKLDVNFIETPLEDVLSICLKGISLTYSIDEKTIIIKKKKEEHFFDSMIIAIDVRGRVVDEKGEPLPGTSVKLKGTSIGTVTDTNGQYTISVPDEKAILVFSFIGFITREVAVNSQRQLTIVLKEDLEKLSEVVVIGYGSVAKPDLTGSIEVVNVGDLNKAPVSSFAEALAGRVAGVQVSSNDGQPGVIPNIIIRGPGSLTQDPSPLYVVDGFPLEGFNTSSINIDDIESISILKDASATAIYGARAANGVVVIETKKGKAGKTVVTFNPSYGYQQIRKTLDVMDPYEFVKYQYEFRPATADARYFQNGKTLDFYKDVRGVNWQDKLFRNGLFNLSNIAIRGGDIKTQFSLSGSLNDHEGIIINTGSSRKQARFTINHSLSNKIRIGLTTNFSNVKTYGVQAALATTSFPSSPANYLFYSSWGYRPVSGRDDIDLSIEEIDDTPDPNDPNTRRVNPVSLVKNTHQVTSIYSNSVNSYLTYNLSKSLIFRTTANLFKDSRNYEDFFNSKTPRGLPIPQNTRGVQANVSYINTDTWSNENTLTYNKWFNKVHRLNALVGFSSQKSTSKIHGYSVMNIPNEELGMSGIDEGTTFENKALQSEFSMASVFNRLNYNYKSKYYLTATFRADGTSKFAKGNKWGYFPSAALAWNLKEENLLRRISFISNSKIRASYGITGNNRVSDFGYLPNLALPIISSYSFNNSTPTKGVIPSGLGNSKLKWEKTEQIDIGYDLGLLKNRIELTVDFYRKTTKDLLLNANLPLATGYTNVYQNIGKLENEGIEVSLITTNFNKNNFSWKTNFNISFNRNKILALARNQEQMFTNILFNSFYNESLYISKIGQSAGMFYGYKWLGNYQYSDFDETSPGVYVLKADVANNGASRATIQPGDIKYADLDGDGIVNDNDRTVIGRVLPKHSGGFTNSFSYKNFDLNIFLQWVYGNKIYNANRLIFEGNSLMVHDLNQYATYLNRWSPENQNNKYFRTGGNGPIGKHSSRVIEDGSFLRLKTISLGYNMPKQIIKKAYLSDLKLVVSGQNLFTWTKYSGFDPEVAVRNTVLTSGLDYSAYPQARTLVFGLNATF